MEHLEDTPNGKCILDTVQILKIAVSLSIFDTVSKILPNPGNRTISEDFTSVPFISRSPECLELPVAGLAHL